MIVFKHLNSKLDLIIDLSKNEINNIWDNIIQIHDSQYSCKFLDHIYIINGKNVKILENKPINYDGKIVYMLHTLR